MANVAGNQKISSGSFTTGKVQTLGSAPLASSSGRSGLGLNPGQRLPLLGGAENTTPIAGQLFPRGLA